MNKQVIKTYFKEFTHWLDGGNILACHENEAKNNKYNWFNPCPVDWRENRIYIINDEYYEFRKALTEGKIVQVDESAGKVGSWKNTIEFKWNPSYYRIKPDGFEFKIGDYAISKANEIFKVQAIDEDGYPCIVKGTCTISYGENCRPWTLEEADDDEWIAYKDTKTAQDFKVCSKNYFLTNTINAKWVVPYIGQTPAQLGLEK